jgi:sigma-B regulation protein RsbU (phosphoserine phosphatase)
MRGYRRRSAAAYLIGVAASFLLVTQLGGTLLQLPEKPWWGLFVGPDDTVRRVDDRGPAAAAGIHKGEAVVSFAGAPWARRWERVLEDDGDAIVEVRSTEGENRTVRLEATPLPPHEIVRHLVSGFIDLSFILIGLVVFLSRSDRIATLFFLMCLAFARIMMPEAALQSTGTFLVDKIVQDAAMMFLPAVLLHFFLCFPQKSRLLARRPRVAWLLYLPAIVGLPLAVVFDVEMVLEGLPASSAALVFEQVTALLFVAMIVAGVWTFLRGVRSMSSPLLRRSVRWVLPGTALGILPPLALAAILNVDPSLEIPGDRYVFVTFVLVPLSFAHAIFRYGLMDLELVVKRSVVYTALTALLVAVYYLVAEVLASWLVERTGTGRTVLSFAVVFAAALLFVPVRDRIQALVDRSFYRKRYSYRRTLRTFSNALATMMERDELVSLLVNRLPAVLDVERATLFVRSPTDQTLRLAETRGVAETDVPLPAFQPSEGLLAWWREFEGPIPVDAARHPEQIRRLAEGERELLQALDAAVLVPLPRERRIEGLLVLGPKRSGDRYRAEDLELLATLGDQAGTALSSSSLYEEALERRRLEEELAVARRIQKTLLPSHIPSPAGIEIAATTRPCSEVGGDYYDFLDFGTRGLGLAVADVSGKGVPAALILSGLQATLRAEASPKSEPEPVVARINQRLCADVGSGGFASLLYGLLDPRDRSFRYVNAGHPAGIVVRRDGSLTRLETGGILLGVETSATYDAGHETFEPGDLLLLFSDGVTDVLNQDDEQFGDARLATLAPRLAHLPVAAVIDSIVSAVETFVGGSLPDDLTILVAKFLPSPVSAADTAA